jgi:hypothetical protein
MGRVEEPFNAPEAAATRFDRRAPVTRGVDFRELREELRQLRTPEFKRERMLRNAGVGQDDFYANKARRQLQKQFAAEDAGYGSQLINAFQQAHGAKSGVDTLNSQDVTQLMASRGALANQAMQGGSYARRDDLNYDVQDRQQNALDRASYLQAYERYGEPFANAIAGGYPGQPTGALPAAGGTFATERGTAARTAAEATAARAHGLAADQDAMNALQAADPNSPDLEAARVIQDRGVLDNLRGGYFENPLDYYPQGELKRTDDTSGGASEFFSRLLNDDNLISQFIRNQPFFYVPEAIQKGTLLPERDAGFGEATFPGRRGETLRVDLEEMTPEQRRRLGTSGSLNFGIQ